MRLRLLPILSALALCALSACDPPAPVYLTDARGRDLVLHGLNVSDAAKNDPLGVAWHTESDYRRMAHEWGFNAVRLLLFWSHVEPRQGKFDTAYLDRMEERVDWAERAGMVVILDFHQDLYARKFGGDGAPEWAVWDGGLPFVPLPVWWLNYLQAPVRLAFENLWKEPLLQQHYFAAWAQVAERFADHPAVIGYDLMNEPFQGNDWSLDFEARLLLPFYRGAAAAIRAADPGAWIWIEPVAFPTNAGLPSLLPALADDRVVYFPHFYDPFMHEGLGYHGQAWLLDWFLGNKAHEAARHGGPFLLGEFGVWPDGRDSDAYLNDLLHSLDRHAAGWTYWSYDITVAGTQGGGGFGLIDRNGNENANVDRLVRTYPRAVAGRILEQRYSVATRTLTLRYRNRAGAIGPTEIFVPVARHYGGSFQVLSSDPPGSWSHGFDPQRRILSVWHDPNTAEHTIEVRP